MKVIFKMRKRHTGVVHSFNFSFVILNQLPTQIRQLEHLEFYLKLVKPQKTAE